MPRDSICARLQHSYQEEDTLLSNFIIIKIKLLHISISFKAKLDFPTSDLPILQSWANASIHPPAIACPFTSDIVGRQNPNNLPKSLINSKIKFILSYGSNG